MRRGGLKRRLTRFFCNKRFSVGALLVLVSCVSVFLNWNSLMHNLSRVYEHVYMVYHYKYDGLDDDLYVKKLSFARKFVCLCDYDNKDEIENLLSDPCARKGKVLSDRGSIRTEMVEGVDGHKFIIKTGYIDGFFKNLIYMSRGVVIWNNARFASEVGIDTIRPIALFEKRSIFGSESSVIYLMEGVDLERGSSSVKDIKAIIDKLRGLSVIHHDFRLRNIICVEGDLRLIDIDKMHVYPFPSHVFHKRMEREINKFNENASSTDHGDIFLF